MLVLLMILLLFYLLAAALGVLVVGWFPSPAATTLRPTPSFRCFYGLFGLGYVSSVTHTNTLFDEWVDPKAGNLVIAHLSGVERGGAGFIPDTFEESKVLYTPGARCGLC